MKRLLFLMLIFLAPSKIEAQIPSKNIKVIIEKLGLEMILSEKFSPMNIEDLIKRIDNKNDNLDLPEFKIEDFENTNIFKINANNLIGISFGLYNNSNNNYSEIVKEKNEAVFQLYKNIFPNAKFESDTTYENIDGVSFLKYFQKVSISNRKPIYHVSYYKLFQNNIDLVIALSYDDVTYGEEMINTVKALKIKQKISN